jgi:hypothetical protein
MKIWRDNIREILKEAAYENKQLVFIITDTQIVFEGMLEDVNNLLNSGEVPNLFVGVDVDDLMQKMKPICVAEGVPLDKVNIYARFIKQCRANLHVCVCMSPMGEPFRNRLRMFPALVSAAPSTGSAAGRRRRSSPSLASSSRRSTCSTTSAWRSSARRCASTSTRRWRTCRPCSSTRPSGTTT